MYVEPYGWSFGLIHVVEQRAQINHDIQVHKYNNLSVNPLQLV